MDKVLNWLKQLRENDFEKYEYYKDFIDILQAGYSIAEQELDLLQDENQKLHEAVERWMIEASKANGIYYQ
jgi:hypothetical protein